MDSIRRPEEACRAAPAADPCRPDFALRINEEERALPVKAVASRDRKELQAAYRSSVAAVVAIDVGIVDRGVDD